MQLYGPPSTFYHFHDSTEITKHHKVAVADTVAAPGEFSKDHKLIQS
jgi:hypothetical protein